MTDPSAPSRQPAGGGGAEAEERNSRRRLEILARGALGVAFPIAASFVFSFLFGLAGLALGGLSSSAVSVPSNCRILSTSVDLRSSKVCELGRLNHGAKHLFYPSSNRRFRCHDDYYWASVFQVEYVEYFSGQISQAVAEAPKKALPHNCRPDFGAAWSTRLKFKVNESYSCRYTLGSSKADIYSDKLFNCKAKEPSTNEMFKRIFILYTMSSRMAGAALARHLGRRLFASTSVSGLTTRGIMPAATRIFPVRTASTAADAKEDAASKPEAAAGEQKKAIVSYWGIEPTKLVKEDGTEWRWYCFRPWDTYHADTTIDVKKHHEPKTMTDKMAHWIVRSLAVPRDLVFQRRHASHALLLETVAAVPGMVGGMLLHLRSLRRFEHSGGWIRALLEEAENERMHLMTFMEVMQPKWYERALVLAVQGAFFNAYFVGYLISPKFAHRVTGYLEEEAVQSYTEYLKDLEAGKVENIPAPAIAIDYWRLPADATLKDVVTVVRADEAHHRDLNHFASDIHYQGMELKDAPAPLGYH